MNERIRSINNTLNMVSDLRDTCKHQLREVLNDEWMDRCTVFIEVGREQQHLKTLERQKHKFERLLVREKVREGDRTTTLQAAMMATIATPPNKTRQLQTRNRRENNWIINLSSTPLTEDEEKALSNGPNYAIVPRIPPIGEYVTTIEQVCNQLEQGKAEELREK